MGQGGAGRTGLPRAVGRLPRRHCPCAKAGWPARRGFALHPRLLDEVKPEPPLFPDDPARRRAVEEAEEWGETVLQPIPRRLLRWAIRHHPDTRVMLARVLGSPRPELVARFMGPVAAFYARREDARSSERVRADWTALPGHLDHIEQLLADGVIGTPEPNSADFRSPRRCAPCSRSRTTSRCSPDAQSSSSPAGSCRSIRAASRR